MPDYPLPSTWPLPTVEWREWREGGTGGTDGTGGSGGSGGAAEINRDGELPSVFFAVFVDGRAKTKPRTDVTAGAEG